MSAESASSISRAQGVDSVHALQHVLYRCAKRDRACPPLRNASRRTMSVSRVRENRPHGSRWRREDTRPVGYAVRSQRLPPTLPGGRPRVHGITRRESRPGPRLETRLLRRKFQRLLTRQVTLVILALMAGTRTRPFPPAKRAGDSGVRMSAEPSLAINPASPVLLHEQVAAAIRRAIAEGEAGPGDRPTAC